MLEPPPHSAESVQGYGLGEVSVSVAEEDQRTAHSLTRLLRRFAIALSCEIMAVHVARHRKDGEYDWRRWSPVARQKFPSTIALRRAQ